MSMAKGKETEGETPEMMAEGPALTSTKGSDQRLLTGEQKVFIIQRLACYDSPSEVVEMVQAEFEITLGRSHVQAYDPTKFNGRALSAELTKLFNETREAFTTGAMAIPIANRQYRLAVLDRLARSNTKSPEIVMQALTTAAREMGDAYTNRVKITGSMTTLKVDPAALEGLSDDELDAAHALALRLAPKKEGSDG